MNASFSNELIRLAGNVRSEADDALIDNLDRDLHQSARAAGLTNVDAVYREHYDRYFAALDVLDAELDRKRYLLGQSEPSSVDYFAALNLMLHNNVYYILYKVNRSRLEDFSNLAHYMRDVFSDRDFRQSIDFDALKKSYFLETDLINPKQRVPLSPVDFDSPHDRALRFVANAQESATQETANTRLSGEWKRKTSAHRNIITRDGANDFAPSAGRYHLYIANNCPWCHRTALTRQLKHLESIVSMDVLYYRRDPERGWQFKPEEPGCTPDSLFGAQFIREIYARVGSDESSVPVLWDREKEMIVSNESAEIIRMFDQAFVEFSPDSPVLFPVALQDQIERLNAFTYHAINNGAYKAGFAASQEAYEDAYKTFFTAVRLLEQMLRGRDYLLGDSMTEADVRLFPTLFRFDAVYYTRFNLDAYRLRDCPALARWLERMCAVPEIIESSNIEHCKKGYFGRSGNNIVPLGPAD